jgi:hypothetical protein
MTRSSVGRTAVSRQNIITRRAPCIFPRPEKNKDKVSMTEYEVIFKIIYNEYSGTPVQTHILALSWSVEKRNNSPTLFFYRSTAAFFLSGIFTAL